MDDKLREEWAKDKLDVLKQTGSYDEYQVKLQKLAIESNYPAKKMQLAE